MITDTDRLWFAPLIRSGKENEKLYKLFKLEYWEAKKHSREQFEFDSQPVLTKFAQYLFDYIDGERKRLGLKVFDCEKNKWIG